MLGTIVVMRRMIDFTSVLLLLVRITRLASHVLHMVAVVIRKGTAQVHHLFLTCILQKLGYTVQLRQRITRMIKDLQVTIRMEPSRYMQAAQTEQTTTVITKHTHETNTQ